MFKGWKNSEVERLLTRLIMGTNLPVVTLFNDMLLGSAPCWGCDSSLAGPAWWITVGGWWCNHSLAATDTCTRQTPIPSGCISWPTQPIGRHNRSVKQQIKLRYLPWNFLLEDISCAFVALGSCSISPGTAGKSAIIKSWGGGTKKRKKGKEKGCTPKTIA